MTEKADTVVKDILQELVVQGVEQAFEGDEVQTTIRYMNRYMSMLDALGISLGYTQVSNLGDSITIPDGAIMGMIKNVAMFIADQYDVEVSFNLQKAAETGLKAMRKLGIDLQPSHLPCTLPIGSGNEDNNGSNNAISNGSGGFSGKFFPCEDDSILTETNRNILLEDET